VRSVTAPGWPNSPATYLGVYATSRRASWRIHSARYFAERHELFVIIAIGERQLDKAQGQARLSLAVNAYGYAHFPIMAGVVLTALGVEGVVAHADHGKALGGFYAWALCGGAALYVGSLLLFGRITLNVWGGFRLTALCLLLAGVPAAAALPPVAVLVGVVVILAAVAVTETHW